jgi:hypothetical protein
MHPQYIVGGEGASAPVFRSTIIAVSSLMVWPLNGPAANMSLETIQQIYCLAYERAQAALRPSTYELALRASEN